MSDITEIILLLSYDDESAVSRLNSIMPNHYNHFTIVPDSLYAGSKSNTSVICVGSFNHLNLNLLINNIQSLNFNFPKSIQLSYMLDDECRFTMIDIFPEVRDD